MKNEISYEKKKLEKKLTLPLFISQLYAKSMLLQFQYEKEEKQKA